MLNDEAISESVVRVRGSLSGPEGANSSHAATISVAGLNEGFDSEASRGEGDDGTVKHVRKTAS